MTPFRERNKTAIGVVGIVAIVSLLAGAFSLDSLVGGEVYKAEFSEAAGLRPNDEVRVAGVKVGKVLAVDLARDRVQVRFRVDTRVGDRSRADIRIKTVLGRKFLSLSPDGDGRLRPGSTIPLERTSSPFDITNAFRDLSTTVTQIDDQQLAKNFQTLADTFRDTPDEVRSSLQGLGQLSRVLAARDAELQRLLQRTRGVSQVLANRDQDLTAFLEQSSLVLKELERRRAAISRLLDTTTELSAQLVALVRDNRADLAPALAQLKGVTDLLRRNQANLDASLQRLAPFVRVFSNNLGNGRWFDTLIQNLVPPPVVVPGAFDRPRTGTSSIPGVAP